MKILSNDANYEKFLFRIDEEWQRWLVVIGHSVGIFIIEMIIERKKF